MAAIISTTLRLRRRRFRSELLIQRNVTWTDSRFSVVCVAFAVVSVAFTVVSVAFAFSPRNGEVIQYP